MSSVIIITIVAIISLGVYILIKKVCKPIKPITAILLVVPTVATCGIALLIYKFFRNTFEVTSYSGKPSPSSAVYQNSINNDLAKEKAKKKEKRKPARAFTDVSGKTSYYDEEGNMIGASIDNGFGQQTFTDEVGNYAATGYSNGLGATTYTDKDGNITSSTTNYKGDETFADGTVAKKDSSGNTYYS